MQWKGYALGIRTLDLATSCLGLLGVRTNLHFESFSLSAKCGGPEAIAALKFYDTCDRLYACIF